MAASEQLLLVAHAARPVVAVTVEQGWNSKGLDQTLSVAAATLMVSLMQGMSAVQDRPVSLVSVCARSLVSVNARSQKLNSGTPSENDSMYRRRRSRPITLETTLYTCE